MNEWYGNEHIDGSLKEIGSKWKREIGLVARRAHEFLKKTGHSLSDITPKGMKIGSLGVREKMCTYVLYKLCI